MVARPLLLYGFLAVLSFNSNPRIGGFKNTLELCTEQEIVYFVIRPQQGW